MRSRLFTSRPSSGTVAECFHHCEGGKPVTATDISPLVLKGITGLDVSEHFSWLWGSEAMADCVTNHCHYMETVIPHHQSLRERQGLPRRGSKKENIHKCQSKWRRVLNIWQCENWSVNFLCQLLAHFNTTPVADSNIFNHSHYAKLSTNLL